MLGGAWFRIGLLLAALGLFVAATAPAVGSEPRAYGQRLVAQYRLPPETIARYAALAAGTAVDASPRPDSMFADRSPWVGPQQRAGSGHNPYTLVLTVSGVARAAGEVYALWQAGWEVHESRVASREVLMKVPPTARAGLLAGQALTLTASSPHVSFRGERSVAPMLGLVQTRNLDIDDVQVQVWSGPAPQVWEELPWSRVALLALGVTCLLGFTYWQPKARARGAQPAHRLDQPGVAPASSAASDGLETASAGDGPVEVAPSHEARVVAALHQVLTVGLAVQTVPDLSRPRRRHATP